MDQHGALLGDDKQDDPLSALPFSCFQSAHGAHISLSSRSVLVSTQVKKTGAGGLLWAHGLGARLIY